MSFRVLGIDPGSRNAGIALLERDRRGWTLIWHVSIAPRKNETADDRMARISTALEEPEDVSCIASEKQRGPSIGNQARGRWNAGNLGVHEVVGRAKHEAQRRRVPFVELATSRAVKAVTGSGNVRGGVDYKSLERALRAQVRGIPARVSQHVLMACCLAVAGARMPGGRRC